MKKIRSIDDVCKELEEVMSGNYTNSGYDIYYTTLQKHSKKHKMLSSYEEVKVWCKRNKNKVQLTSGHWRILEYMESLRSTEDIINDNDFGLIRRYNNADIRRTRENKFFVDGYEIGFEMIETCKNWIDTVIKETTGKFVTGEYIK